MSNDITFCANSDCNKRDTCYRYCANAPIEIPVSMAQFEFDENGNCEYYIMLNDK